MDTFLKLEAEIRIQLHISTTVKSILIITKKGVYKMFQHNQKPFNYIPQTTIKIPLNQQVAALVLHMFQHRFGSITISLEEVQEQGVQLVLSTLIDNTCEEKKYRDVLGIVENEDINSLQELINSMIEEKFNENDEELLEHFRQLNDEEDEEEWEDEEEELAF
jgi:hypothetical protein